MPAVLLLIFCLLPRFLFSCLSVHYLNIMVPLDIFIVILDVSICMVFLVVALGITTHMHNLSVYGCQHFNTCSEVWTPPSHLGAFSFLT